MEYTSAIKEITNRYKINYINSIFIIINHMPKTKKHATNTYKIKQNIENDKRSNLNK